MLKSLSKGGEKMSAFDRLQELGWQGYRLVELATELHGEPDAIFEIVDRENRIITIFTVSARLFSIITFSIDNLGLVTTNTTYYPITEIAELREDNEPVNLQYRQSGFDSAGFKLTILLKNGQSYTLDQYRSYNQEKIKDLRFFAKVLKSKM
jgi:hypothetical protein